MGFAQNKEKGQNGKGVKTLLLLTLLQSVRFYRIEPHQIADLMAECCLPALARSQ